MVLGGLERPSAGHVRIDGHDLGALGEDALARLRRAAIGIVFQSFHLIPTMTALENVALPLELGGRARRVRRRRRGARRGRPRPSPRPLSGAALGRRAAARGDRPRLYRRPRAAARRRADRQSRRRHRPPRHRLPVRAAGPARHDPAADHPRFEPRRALRAPDPAGRRQHRRGPAAPPRCGSAPRAARL